MSAPAPAKRTITIDSSLQAFSKRSGRNRHKSAKTGTGDPLKPKLKPNQFIRPSTLKKQLLARIKTHQKKHAQTSSLTAPASQIRPATTPAIESTPATAPKSNTSSSTMQTAHHVPRPVPQTETFMQSLEYLQSLSSNNRENRHNNNNKHRHKNKTQKMDSHHVDAVTNQAPVALDLGCFQGQPQTIHQMPPQVSLDSFPTQPQGQLPVQPQFQPQLQPELYNNAVMPVMMPSAHATLSDGSNWSGSNPFASFYPLPQSPVVTLNEEPRWGCLKSGSKPTFRTFHNKTCKLNTMDDDTDMDAGTNVDTNPLLPENNDASTNEPENADTNAVSLTESLYGSRQQRLDEYRQDQLRSEKKTVEPSIKIKQTKQHIVTKRYKLGKYDNKNGPVIGVLIKNIQTQRNIEKKRNELRRIPLDTVISRLHKKRLLKVGSTAPPDILREMYESSVMAGDIENEGNDIAMHNFLSGTGTDSDAHST